MTDATGKALLTETEVAQRLRCSASKVKRLRLSGDLPYIAGRPVLIDEADLAAWLDGQKLRAQLRSAPATCGRTRGASDARAWAFETIALRGSRKGGANA